jgi:hypothetical protein
VIEYRTEAITAIGVLPIRHGWGRNGHLRNREPVCHAGIRQLVFFYASPELCYNQLIAKDYLHLAKSWNLAGKFGLHDLQETTAKKAGNN